MGFYIEVSDYKKHLGKNTDEHIQFKNWFLNELDGLLNHFRGNSAFIYNLKGEYHTYKVGKKGDKLIIFNNASVKGAVPPYKLNQEVIVGDYIYHFENDMLGLHGSGIPIESDNGIPLAEFFKEDCQLNILYNVMDEYSEENLNIIKHILTSLNAIFKEELLVNSWKHSKEKDKLIKKIKESTESMTTRLIRELKIKESKYKGDVAHYKLELKKAVDNLTFIMKQLEEIKDDKDTIAEKIIKDLDLILSCELIEDVFIENDLFKVYTKDLIITDDKGRRYKGGNFEITIDMKNCYVTFKGSLKKQGFWSNKDPHPHISYNGEACLGNISSTVAELCSQNELYALVTILLDFLQSANTNDAAGKYVQIYWDEIDENGNVIEKEEKEEYTWVCDCCGESYTDDDDCYTVYEGIDEDGYLYGERIVCTACRDEHYVWDEDVEEYLEC